MKGRVSNSVSTGEASAPERVLVVITMKPQRVLTEWKLVQVTNAEKFHSGPRLFKIMHSERDETYLASINYNLKKNNFNYVP